MPPLILHTSGRGGPAAIAICGVLAPEYGGRIVTCRGGGAALAEDEQIEREEIPLMRLSDEARTSEKMRERSLRAPFGA